MYVNYMLATHKVFHVFRLGSLDIFNYNFVGIKYERCFTCMGDAGVGSFGQTRTDNSTVNSRMLYLLSYKGIYKELAPQVGFEPTTSPSTACFSS